LNAPVVLLFVPVIRMIIDISLVVYFNPGTRNSLLAPTIHVLPRCLLRQHTAPELGGGGRRLGL